MNCKKCGLLIDKDSNFCPYCGEKNKIESTQREYDDPFKDLRIDNSHNGQYQYQQAYSNINNNKTKDTLNEINRPKNNSVSLISLILGIISVFLCFISKTIGVGIFVSIIAIILSIIGYKNTRRGLGVAALVITIFTFIISIIITVFMLVASITITFENNYETTIKQYFIDAFFNGFNESRLEGYWIDSSNELLYLDDEGNYYIYLDNNELTDNYYYGSYQIESGLELNYDETLYADNDYYYYRIDTLFNKAKIDGEVYYETIDLIENGFTLKLDKENKNNLILISGETEIEFERR